MSKGAAKKLTAVKVAKATSGGSAIEISHAAGKAVGFAPVAMTPLVEGLASWSVVLNGQVRDRVIFAPTGGVVVSHTFLITNQGPSAVFVANVNSIGGGAALGPGEAVVVVFSSVYNGKVGLVLPVAAGSQATVTVSLLAVR